MVETPIMDRRVSAETIQLLNERILYPYQKNIFAVKGELIINDDVKHGILCLTDCALTFYHEQGAAVYDYNLTDVLDFSHKKGFVSSRIEISLKNSVKIIIKDVPRGQEELQVRLLRQAIEQWKQFEEGQKAKGFVRYGLNQDQWGPKEEVQSWLKQYLAERGFKKVEGKWMTKQEHFDYRQRQKGLYKYIESENEKWASIDEILNGLSPFKFQDFIGVLLESMGYEITKLPYVGDYGADLLARKGGERVVIQVKKFGPDNKVGAKEVQQILGATWKYNALRAILITTSSFTKQAYEQARDAPIELWDREKLKEALSQYLPSNLVPETPLKVDQSQIHKLEELYKTIVSKAASLASPQTAMRIKIKFEKKNGSFVVTILGPHEMYHLIEKATKELLYTLTPEFKRFFTVWLNTIVAKTELKHLKETYPFFDEL